MGHAYLSTKTYENIYFIGGQQFGTYLAVGNTVVVQVLYTLK